jgi:hypothetical protein
MTRSTPAGRRRQARLMRLVNLPMRALLQLPLPTPLGHRLMLVTITGRRTGRRYRQPVSYLRDGDTLLTPGGGRWTLNLRPDQPNSIRLRGRDILAYPDAVADPDAVDELLQLIADANPSSRRFVRIPRQPDGHHDPQALRAAIEHGFRIIRWRPTTAID